MNINNDLAKRGNGWMERFILTEDNSEFVEFQVNAKNPSEITAVYNHYPNADSKTLGVGSRLVKVSYRRLDLKQLFVKFEYLDQDDFYQKVLDEINRVISNKFGEQYQIDLAEIDIQNCHYHDRMAKIAVKQDCAFWFDFCHVTNAKK